MNATTPASLIDQAFPKQWLMSPSPFLRGRGQVVDRLLYGVFHHRRIQLLSGPDGAGKTIALRRLQPRLQGRRTVVAIDGAGIDGEQDLLLALCNALDQQPRPAHAIVKACLQARLKTLAEQDRAVVLIIDDGDDLGTETLDAIRAWTRGDGDHGKHPLTAIIACRPALAERLAADPRYWLQVPLRPLTLTGTGRYLQQRLGRVGIRGPGPFDRARTKQIRKQSQGWPGAIDGLARDLLQQEGDSLRRRRTPVPAASQDQRPRRNLSGLLFLLLLVLLAWWYRTPLLDQSLSENRDRVVERFQKLGHSLADYVSDQLDHLRGTPRASLDVGGMVTPGSAADDHDEKPADEGQSGIESGL